MVVRTFLSFQWRPKYRRRVIQKASSLGQLHARTDVLRLDLGWLQRALVAFVERVGTALWNTGSEPRP